METKITERKKATLKNSSIGIIERIIMILLQFISRTFFIKYLGIEILSVHNILIDIMNVFAVLELGVGSVVLYRLYKPMNNEDYYELNRFLTFYRNSYRVISIVLLTMGLLFLTIIRFVVDESSLNGLNIHIIFMLFLINVISSYLFNYRSIILLADQKSRVISKISIVFTVIKSVGEIAIIFLFKDYYLFLIFSFSSQLIQYGTVYIVTKKMYPLINVISKSGLNTLERKKLFKDIRAGSLYKISAAVLNGTDSIIISLFLGTTLIGILSNYNLFIVQIYAILIIITQSLSYSIGNYASTKSEKQQYNLFMSLYLANILFVGITSVIFFLVIDRFIILWIGPDFLVSKSVSIALTIDYLVKGVLATVTSFRTSNGIFYQGRFRPLVMAILNLLLSIVLVKLIGLPGVILGTIISRLLTQSWYDPYIVFRLVFKEKMIKFFIMNLKLVSSFAISILVSVYTLGFFNFNSKLVDFIIALFIGSTITVIIFLFFFIKDIKARVNIKKLIRFVK